MMASGLHREDTQSNPGKAESLGDLMRQGGYGGHGAQGEEDIASLMKQGSHGGHGDDAMRTIGDLMKQGK
jgi:hypothetical protein